jgi:2-amino-4-hydroxy-6-hydroxymethyldihydropteridine diphosphokinase
VAAGAGRPVRVYVGLGANVGDARATLRDAVAALAAMPGARLTGVSRLYRTKPVGVLDQPDFLNAVVGLELTPHASASVVDGATLLLVQLKDLEREFGRQKRRRWGPRELDLDLLVYGDARLSMERPPAGIPLSAAIDPRAATRLLVVPHPTMAERLFVLAPLADLAPGLIPPGWTRPVDEQARRLAALEPDAVVAVGRWDGARRDWR